MSAVPLVGLERQVRIDGLVEKVTAAESDAYYASRPLGARLSAWASAQSEKSFRVTSLRTPWRSTRAHGDNPPRPPHWGGYRVTPHEMEFWQGRSDRLHDRLRYRRFASPPKRWTIERLSPEGVLRLLRDAGLPTGPCEELSGGVSRKSGRSATSA